MSVSARAIRAYGGHDVMRDGDHRVPDAGTERRDEGERQDQTREREEDVGDAHQRRVDEPARIAGDGAHASPMGAARTATSTTTNSVMREP